MGTDCHIVVVGPGSGPRVNRAKAHVDQLEQLWSRFLPSSDVSRVNEADGTTVTVDEQTLALFERAVLARTLTQGRFNPFMGRQITQLGYSRPMQLARPEDGDSEATNDPSPHVPWRATIDGDISIDRGGSTVRLTAAVAFDPGGIGKGLAADLVTAAMIDDGAWGAMVNLGGDLRVRGTPPRGDAWAVQIAEPTVSRDHLSTIRLIDGAVATSTTGRRRWQRNGQDLHHLLDPDTGRPAISGPVLSTVIAGEAWWAEAAATAICATGKPHPQDAAVLVVGADGTIERLGGFEAFEVAPNDLLEVQKV